ncbi:MAG: hypothetical protein Q9225_007839, partial [Loekoesia sp. 1 TL-2023]
HFTEVIGIWSSAFAALAHIVKSLIMEKPDIHLYAALPVDEIIFRSTNPLVNVVYSDYTVRDIATAPIYIIILSRNLIEIMLEGNNFLMDQNCGVSIFGGVPEVVIESPPSAAFGVSKIQTSSTEKPTKTPLPRRVVMQHDAPEDLDLVWWPAARPLPLLWKLTGYIYDVFSEMDTYMYVNGDGINLDHQAGPLSYSWEALLTFNPRISA